MGQKSLVLKQDPKCWEGTRITRGKRCSRPVLWGTSRCHDAHCQEDRDGSALVSPSAVGHDSRGSSTGFPEALLHSYPRAATAQGCVLPLGVGKPLPDDSEEVSNTQHSVLQMSASSRPARSWPLQLTSLGCASGVIRFRRLTSPCFFSPQMERVN